MTLLIEIGVIVLSACAFLFFLAIQVIDMASRVDYLQSHLPRLVKWAEHKEWHGILLLIVALLLAGNLYEITHGNEPLNVKLTVGTADEGARNAENAEIENLRSQLSACKSASCTSTQNAGLELLYGEQPLTGQTIPALDRRSSLNVTFGNLRARNKGHTTTGRIHLRLYFSEKIESHMPGIWVPTASDEPNFPSEFYLNLGDNARIDGLEVFNFEPDFSGTIGSQTPEVRAQLKCFYGAKSPAVADFLIEEKIY